MSTSKFSAIAELLAALTIINVCDGHRQRFIEYKMHDMTLSPRVYIVTTLLVVAMQ